VSIPVPLDRLRAALAERGDVAFLLTVTDAGAPHAVHVALAWDGEHLVTEVGARTAANATARVQVSLLCPPRTDGDYSLIADGIATVDGRRIAIAPTRAVFHRAARGPAPAAASCDADCVPLLDPTAKPRR
jgi:hypothetical protein